MHVIISNSCHQTSDLYQDCFHGLRLNFQFLPRDAHTMQMHSAATSHAICLLSVSVFVCLSVCLSDTKPMFCQNGWLDRQVINAARNWGTSFLTPTISAKTQQGQAKYMFAVFLSHYIAISQKCYMIETYERPTESCTRRAASRQTHKGGRSVW